jgi:hypothetical protein
LVKLSNTLSRNPELRTIIADGIEAALLPAGFAPTGRRWTWARPAKELTHLIGVLTKVASRSYTVQWSIGCPPAAAILWGEGDARDISFNVMAGLPSGIVRGALGDGWTLSGSTTPNEALEIAAAAKADLRVVAARLYRLQTRRELWNYLLENREPVDRRDFLFPAMLPFKLVTAAALALAGYDREGCDLLPEVMNAWSKVRDRPTRERLARLEAAAKSVCA